MRQVVVEQFGGPEVLTLKTYDTVYPGAGELMVKLTSIGLNRAEVMGRKGHYKLSTGEPPFVPGLEGGGVVEAVGDGVDRGWLGRRVVLSPEAPRLSRGLGGTYRSHYRCTPDDVVTAPDGIADDLLGALWLSHLTAWGCLVWKHRLREGQRVAISAASSSVGLAAAQVVRSHGGVAIGLTSSPGKANAIADQFDRVIVTHEPDRTLRPFHRDLREATGGDGPDVCFDCVAAGAYLDAEVRAVNHGGTIYLYGLLGKPDTVDLSPLIRKRASITGWVNDELVAAGRDHWLAGCRHVMQGFARGQYHQRIAARFPLEKAGDAHTFLERNQHIGKVLLVP